MEGWGSGGCELLINRCWESGAGEGGAVVSIFESSVW